MKRLINIIKRQTMNSEGFTLLEAMIGMFVFVFGILGLLTLETTGIRNNTLAEDVQINTVTAMAQIEELMATDFLDQRVNGNGTNCGPGNDPRYTICVQRLDDQAIPGAKRVIVTSRFTPTGGSPIGHADGSSQQTITLSIFKPDIDHVTP